ncbi:hypothetical protein HB364_13920 [Pseudoflavitalea sp. X16]|uniref:hypothetical protein n=1 Tax=Paraflavitalea devenefica TaxID=2716334 RepID=UPI00141E2B49|nr:hypothetical protein [Paraflavitalea devenefica]NII26186.1 hypothetical protein [Paraflavitalea devenefica]
MSPLFLAISLCLAGASQKEKSMPIIAPVKDVFLHDTAMTIDQKCQLLQTLIGEDCRYRINAFDINFELRADNCSYEQIKMLADAWSLLMFDFVVGDSLAYFNTIDIRIIHNQTGLLRHSLLAWQQLASFQCRRHQFPRQAVDPHEKVRAMYRIILGVDTTRSDFMFCEDYIIYDIYLPTLHYQNDVGLLARAKAMQVLSQWYIFSDLPSPMKYAKWNFFDRTNEGPGKQVGYNHQSKTFKSGQVKWPATIRL